MEDHRLMMMLRDVSYGVMHHEQLSCPCGLMYATLSHDTTFPEAELIGYVLGLGHVGSFVHPLLSHLD